MKTLALLTAIALVSVTVPAGAGCPDSGCAIEQPDTKVLPPTPEGCPSPLCLLLEQRFQSEILASIASRASDAKERAGAANH
jgi:hypothetical protein